MKLDFNSFAIIKPEGAVVERLFANRTEAVDYAVSRILKATARRGVDGSNLEWKSMKRQGWSIAPVSHTVLN